MQQFCSQNGGGLFYAYSPAVVPASLDGRETFLLHLIGQTIVSQQQDGHNQV